MVDRKKSLVERLEAQPELKERIEAILAIAENEDHRFAGFLTVLIKLLSDVNKIHDRYHPWHYISHFFAGAISGPDLTAFAMSSRRKSSTDPGGGKRTRLPYLQTW
jgi:hypothetical protein